MALTSFVDGPFYFSVDLEQVSAVLPSIGAGVTGRTEVVVLLKNNGTPITIYLKDDDTALKWVRNFTAEVNKAQNKTKSPSGDQWLTT